MTDLQERILQVFRRILGWFAANVQYVTNNPALGTQLETLTGIVSRMSDHAAKQETQHARTLLVSTDEIEKRREVLSHQMIPIAKVARALRGTVPGIAVLTVPRANVPTPALITAATAMAAQAVIYKDVLVESGLPADFIEQLTAAAATLKASIDSRGLARAARVAATEGVGSESVLGRRTVAIIDALVTRQLRNDPSKLAEWQQLKRVVLKGVAVRAPLGVVNAGSTPVQTSSTSTVAASDTSVKAS
jgi:hypothetical protein